MSREPSTLSTGSRKKIEQYSYSLNDKIGKGYSSIVYRGRNDETSKEFCKGQPRLPSPCLPSSSYLRWNSGSEGHRHEEHQGFHCQGNAPMWNLSIEDTEPS